MSTPMAAMLSKTFAPISIAQPQVVQAAALPMLKPDDSVTRAADGSITFGHQAGGFFAGRTVSRSDPLYGFAQQTAQLLGG